MARIEYPGDDNTKNPLIVVEPEEVVGFVRQLADDLGLADRSSIVVQTDFPWMTEKPNPEHIWSPPRLTLMVSGIANSREKKEL